MTDIMYYKGYKVSFEYGWHTVFLHIAVSKRVGQLVKADITPIEGSGCYIHDITQFKDYANIHVNVNTRSFEWIDDLVEYVIDNMTITKYINMDSHRASYELSRALG